VTELRPTRLLVNGSTEEGIPGDDPGFTRGLNVFETLRTYGSVPFRLERHLARLVASADAMGIAVPMDALRSDIDALLEADVCIRITLTAGGNRVVHAVPVDATRIGREVRVASVPSTSTSWLPGSVKHGSRAGWILASRRLNADEVIFVDDDGHILEANRSNVFAVIEGELRTPPLDGHALEGVTRGALIDAARQAGIDLREVPVPLSATFDEFYLSSTLKELSPVDQLDDRHIGGGPVGARLLNAFRALVAASCGGP
jgi:branched-subunit amino acid aminotransferase/4-amino-4-deoxychorismate lyase